MTGAATITLTDFLHALHPPDSRGVINLRALPSKRQAFVRVGDLDAVERFIATNPDQNLYCGVAVRKNSGDGSLANCSELHVLFVDLDFKDTPEAEPRAKLGRFPLPPSIVVNSGGGLHCYWILREPFDLQDSEDRKRAKNLLRRLALALGGDMNAAEPARILRIPGTLNHKPEYGTPRPVLIEAFNPERAYNPADFDDVLPEEPAAGNGQGFTIGEKIKNGERNITLYKEARSLKAKGFGDPAILAAAKAENTTKCEPPLDPTEIEKIVAHAIAQPDRQEFMANSNGEADHHQQSGGLPLTRLGDLLAEPEEAVAWLVDNRLPSGGLSIMAAKPKVGKSTLARCLALAVVQGEPWLGCATHQGPVFYLALEEKRAELRRHFEAMGATEQDPLWLFIGSSPADGLAQLRTAANLHKPALIVVDPLFRFVKVRDGNDYASVTGALEPLLTLARQTGAHVLLVHHSSKKGSGDGDGILGSTAIFGSVDTALLLSRREHYRTLRSIQRYGPDLEEVTLELDPDSRMISVGQSRQQADEEAVGGLIVKFLQSKTGPVEEKDILERVEAKRAAKVKILRHLVDKGTVTRLGKGGKGDSYRYAISDSCSDVPIYVREQAKQTSKNDVSSENNSAFACSRDFDQTGDQAETSGTSIFPQFEEDDPGLLAARLVDAEELNPAWGEVDV